MNINIITNVKHKQTYLLAVFPWILSFNFTLHDINYIWFCYANLQMHNSPSGNPTAPPHTISGNLGSCSLAFSGKSGNCMNMKIKMVYGLPTILYIFKLTKLYLNLAIESRKHIQFAQYFISPNCRSNSRFSGSSYILKFQFVLFCMY